MPKRPPIYTFQRPRRKHREMSNSQVETYTSTDVNNTESNVEKTVAEYIKDTATYQKWTLYTTIAMVIMMILSIIYVQWRGMTVRISTR